MRSTRGGFIMSVGTGTSRDVPRHAAVSMHYFIE